MQDCDEVFIQNCIAEFRALSPDEQQKLNKKASTVTSKKMKKFVSIGSSYDDEESYESEEDEGSSDYGSEDDSDSDLEVDYRRKSTIKKQLR